MLAVQNLASVHLQQKDREESISCLISTLSCLNVDRWVSYSQSIMDKKKKEKSGFAYIPLYFWKDKHDLLVIPGGAQGAETISKHPSVQELVRRYLDSGKLVGMICAGAFVWKLFALPKKKNFFFVCEWFFIYCNTGSLMALTAKLPSQPLTSHPSVRPLLENGNRTRNNFYALF